eukprot:TRINITY_DN5751_c1_g1_i1.p1 TRINITY_DN5751_c1_g1~~TRINITY_DN5751_c1_g1_i1.p1  ORF type:complete len:568 (-),score=85.06 TRINITY_DN5751_c1_g1_i1:289-1887(-)
MQKDVTKKHVRLDVSSKVESEPADDLADVAIRRCRELIRTVRAFASEENVDEGPPAENVRPSLADAGEGLWLPPPDPNAETPDDIVGATEKPEAAADPEAGGLFLSHVWDEPEGWAEHFGPTEESEGLSYAAAKQAQVASSLREAERRQFPRPWAPTRVWVDFASLPEPVTQADHPLEQTVFGPYRLPIRELKSFVPRQPHAQEQVAYTLLHLPEGHSFEGVMKKTEYDDQRRPLQNSPTEEVSWSIPAGWHFIRSCRAIPEGPIPPWETEQKPEYRPLTEQLRTWCTRLALRNEAWVEFTLGSLRSECLLLADTMLTLHCGMVAVAPWNYFDRLWPLWEWAVYCARCGPHRIQLACDSFTQGTLEKYHQAIRKVSVLNAGCRDERDRTLLLDALEALFNCKIIDETVGYERPAGECTHVVKKRVVDFSAVERFVQITAIAIFAREAALVASREHGVKDEAGWVLLAKELGFTNLHKALKLCKPWFWTEPLRNEGSEEEQIDLEYRTLVEQWWEDHVLPEVELERQLALKPI